MSRTRTILLLILIVILLLPICPSRESCDMRRKTLSTEKIVDTTAGSSTGPLSPLRGPFPVTACGVCRGASRGVLAPSENAKPSIPARVRCPSAGGRWLTQATAFPTSAATPGTPQHRR